jgi:chitodextrinase
MDRCGKPMKTPYFKMGVYKHGWKYSASDSKVRELFIDNLKIVEGKGSPVVQDTKAPSAPTKLKASSITQTSIKLNWNAPSDNVGVAGYEVNYNGKTKSVTGTSTTLTGLTPNVNYSIKVRAKDTSGNKSSYSNPETAVTDATVGIYPILVANAGLDKEKRCDDTYRTLGKASSKPTSDGAIYLWTTTNGQISGAINGKTAKGTKAGTYTLTVSKSGYTSAKDTVVITQEKGCATTQPVVNNPKAPTPIKTNLSRYGAGYEWKPVKGAEGYALYSIVDGHAATTYTAASSSDFHCENDINNCWAWIPKPLPSGKGNWWVAAKVNGVWSKWSNATAYDATNISTSKESDAAPSKVAFKANTPLSEPAIPQAATADNEETSGGGSFPISFLVVGLLALMRRRP